MKKFLLITLAMVFMLGSFTMSAQASGEGSVTVFVNPGASPFGGGATVTVTVNGQVLTATASGQTGIATFPSIPPGKYTFKATKAGCTPGEITQDIFGGMANMVTIKFGAITGGATITVLDKITKQPVSAQVSWAKDGYSGYLNTNSSGVVNFTGLQTATYVFKALALSTTPYMYPNEGSISAVVPATGTVSTTILMSRPFNITVSFASSPVGLRLETAKFTNGSNSTQTLTSVAGTQTLSVPDTGTYWLLVKWSDKYNGGSYKYIKSSTLNITGPGSYSINPAAGTPISPF